MAKKTKAKSFYNPDDKGKDKNKNTNEMFRGDLAGYKYGVYREGNVKGRKKEDKIVAQFMNNQSIDFTSSVWYSPELSPEMWLMPKSRLETLRWTRLFYNMDPYIHSIINMHSTYPFSMFTLNAEDPEVTKFYEDVSFNESFNLYDFILQMSLSYNKFGEAIVMNIMEEVEDQEVPFYKWKKLILFEPEFIEVRQAFFEDKPRYYLQITEEMKKDVQEALAEGREIQDADKMLHEDEVLLDEEQMSQVMNITDASANRGTSPVQSLLRVLLYQDKVNMLKLTAIDRFRYPIEIWKIGNIEKNIKPNMTQLRQFEEYIKTAKNNPPFSLFVPPIVEYEVVGYGNEKNIFDYQEDYEWTRDAIMTGLGVNKGLILGEGPSMSNVKDLALMKLFMTYKVIQDKFQNWMINHFYRPLAVKNKFFRKDGSLDLPEIHWEKPLNLDRDETEDYMELWEKGIIDTRTLMSKYKGLDYEKIEQAMKDELGSVFDDGKRILNRDIKPKKKGGEGDGGDRADSLTPIEEGGEGGEGIDEETVVEEEATEETTELE